MSTLIHHFKATWSSEEVKTQTIVVACAVIALVVNARYFFFI